MTYKITEDDVSLAEEMLDSEKFQVRDENLLLYIVLAVDFGDGELNYDAHEEWEKLKEKYER